jgi:hypothetical protein
MNTVKFVRELLTVVVLSLLLMLLVAAMADPRGFGDWLGMIDTARYNCDHCLWEHDYTEDY